ncbi:hypothetical protein BDV40DRAFT_292958 [Aspergillus tamarii]|uniref:Rhodopsin domain-containing protein n=1 Tax=Aspergillus tamarii TaxID=41984 RepID=A0A5N6UEV6_ASPTM|nr:hypothetical protein BDV40DRAFT_292958 [Aspergillus tamarii]
MDTSMPLVGRSRAIFIVCVRWSVSYKLHMNTTDYTDCEQALFTFLNICCIIGTQNGVGHKLTDFTSLDTLQKAMLWWWLGQMLYIWSSAVAKVSIALALIRLTVRKTHMIILWTVIAVVIAIGLMFWLVLLFDCNPVSYFWERLNPTNSGTCLSTDILLAIAYLYSALTIFCDFTLGIFPVFLVWNLQMNRRTKAALGGILSMGAMGKYPLSSLTGNASKTAASRDPRYWRPDIASDDTSTFVVTSVSSPDRLHGNDNSSQEVLYRVPDPWTPPNSVNVHKTFRVGEEGA